MYTIVSHREAAGEDLFQARGRDRKPDSPSRSRLDEEVHPRLWFSRMAPSMYYSVLNRINQLILRFLHSAISYPLLSGLLLLIAAAA